MGFFDIFKNKKTNNEPHYDPLNITLRALEENYLLDYNYKTWTVSEMFEYDWGEDFFTREYLIVNANEKKYLHIEEQEDKLEITLSDRKIAREITPTVIEAILKESTIPSQLIYEGQMYYLKEESAGYYRNVNSEDWLEFLYWTFTDKTQKNTITLEQWGENEFEAFKGIIVSETEFSEILPNQN